MTDNLHSLGNIMVLAEADEKARWIRSSHSPCRANLPQQRLGSPRQAGQSDPTSVTGSGFNYFRRLGRGEATWICGGFLRPPFPKRVEWRPSLFPLSTDPLYWRHVSQLQQAPKRREGTSLLVGRGEPPSRPPCGATSRPLLGRDHDSQHAAGRLTTPMKM